MLNKLKSFLKKSGDKDSKRNHTLPLAVAAVLVEVMRIDGRLEKAEHDSVIKALKSRFDLLDAEIDSLINDAKQQTAKSHDLHQFTSQIIKAFGTEERIEIIKELWQVAMADGHVDPHEEHLIRRTAELIGVYHREFIRAKIQARQEKHHE